MRKALAQPRRPKWKPTYLRRYREWKGLTVEELAAAMPYNSGSLNEIENGHKRYNQDVLDMAARVLDVPPSFLIGRPPPPIGQDIDRSDPFYLAWRMSRMSEKQAADFASMAPTEN